MKMFFIVYFSLAVGTGLGLFLSGLASVSKEETKEKERKEKRRMDLLEKAQKNEIFLNEYFETGEPNPKC